MNLKERYHRLDGGTPQYYQYKRRYNTPVAISLLVIGCIFGFLDVSDILKLGGAIMILLTGVGMGLLFDKIKH